MTYEEIVKLPKSDLHNHATRGANIRDIVPNPKETLQTLPKYFDGLDGMQKWYEDNVKVHLSGKDGYIKRIKGAFVQANRDNVSLLSMSFGYDETSLFSSVKDFVECIFDLHQTYAKDIEFIPELALSRNQTQEQAMNQLKSVLPYNFFKAIDLMGDEFIPVDHFIDVFHLAKKNHLMCKVHIGEFAGPELIEETLAKLWPDQIQHGIRAIESEKVMSMIQGRGVILNVCPTSNVMLTKYNDIKKHPIRTLLDNNIKVTVNTDDLLIFDSTINQELFLLLENNVISDQELLDIVQTGLNSYNMFKEDLLYQYTMKELLEYFNVPFIEEDYSNFDAEKRWEDVFLKNVTQQEKEKININQHPPIDEPCGMLWHGFSFELVNHLQGASAYHKIASMNTDEWLIFVNTDQTHNVIRVKQTLDVSLLTKLDKYCWTDIFITDIDFTWTYIMDHESMGPYYSDKSMAIEPLLLIGRDYVYNFEQYWNFSLSNTYNYFLKHITDGSMLFYSIKNKERIFGELYALLDSPDKDEANGENRAYLLAYRIEKEFQNKGYGKKLMNTVIQELESLGYNEITIGVDNREYEKLSSLYSSFGFTEILKEKDVDLHYITKNGTPEQLDEPYKLLIRRTNERQ